MKRPVVDECSKGRPITLKDCVKDEGFDLVVHPRPWEGDGALGSPGEAAFACVAEGKRVYCVADTWDLGYSVSHEIAESRHGFQHTAEMFEEQSIILARWLRSKGHQLERNER